MIRRVTNRIHDDARDVTQLRLDCGHATETRTLGASYARCEQCARARAQDLLRGRYGAAFRALVERSCAAGALASQEEIRCD